MAKRMIAGSSADGSGPEPASSATAASRLVAYAGAQVRPATPAQLHAWLRHVLDIDAPRGASTPGSDAPFAYLCWAFFEEEREGAGDCVVWACRGGGKTFYAAVATVLDLIFKPGVEVKILGGSLEQSRRMHAHLRRLLERSALRGLVDGKIGERRGRLLNGSSVEVLAQSHTSVRGARPQKLRCDEVELFDPDVWRAAQLVTRSKWCGVPAGDTRRARARGSVEALSTMHRAGGIMSALVGETAHRRLFRWGVVDVLERCGPRHACERCALWEECGGAAKKARRDPGHVSIDDAVQMKHRADAQTWESEMLCQRPMVHGAVYPEFDPAVHCVDEDVAIAIESELLPGQGPRTHDGWAMVAGMDFGFRGATAILWGLVGDDGVLRIVDERVREGVVLEEHTRALLTGRPGLGASAAEGEGVGRRWPVPRWVGVDPAGAQRSVQSGQGAIHVMRQAGLMVVHRRLGIEEGLRLVRARLAPASGSPRLLVHRRCVRLIESLCSYRWPEDARATQPVKDGHDHAADALRYLVVNLDAAHRSQRVAM